VAREKRRAFAFAFACVAFVAIDALERHAWGAVFTATGRLNATTFNAYKAARYDALRLWSYCAEAEDDASMLKVLRYVFYPPLRVSGPLLRFREFERHRNRSAWRVVASVVEIIDACAWLAMFRLASATYYGAYDAATINASALHAVLFAWTHTTVIWMSSFVVFTVPHALALMDGQVATRDVTLDWRAAGTSFSHFWRTFHASLNEAFVAYIYDPLGSGVLATCAVMAFSLLFHGFQLAWVKFFAINTAGLLFERALKSYRTSRVILTAAYQTILFMLFTFCTMPIAITPAYFAINFLLFWYFHRRHAETQASL
jgi:D-alanyl-lipoteichoic acid acyltransferase DltB (MBOAT superfamily)